MRRRSPRHLRRGGCGAAGAGPGALAKRYDGVVSVLAKNAQALALRPALQARWADALEALDSDRYVGTSAW